MPSFVPILSVPASFWTAACLSAIIVPPVIIIVPLGSWFWTAGLELFVLCNVAVPLILTVPPLLYSACLVPVVLTVPPLMLNPPTQTLTAACAAVHLRVPFVIVT